MTTHESDPTTRVSELEHEIRVTGHQLADELTKKGYGSVTASDITDVAHAPSFDDAVVIITLGETQHSIHAPYPGSTGPDTLRLINLADRYQDRVKRLAGVRALLDA